MGSMEQLISHEIPFHLDGILRGYSAEITCLRFSDDGSLLASVQDASSEVWIWDVCSQKLLQRLPGSATAFSPDGSVLAVIDEGITLWECATWRCLERLPLHPTFLAFSSDGKAFITMNAAGRFSIIDVATHTSLFAFDALTDLSRPGLPAVSPTLSCFALPTSANQARLWLFESTTGEALYLDTILADFEEGLAFSPNGVLLATLVAGKRKQRVRLYHVGKQEDLGPLEPDVGPIWRGWWPLGPGPAQKRIQKESVIPTQAIAFSPDSSYLVVGAPNGLLFLWNVQEPRLITSFAAHPDPEERDARFVPWAVDGIRSVAWSKSRNMLATGGLSDEGDFIIKLWSFQPS